MKSRYITLNCERCKNRRAKLHSKQGIFCENMIKGEETTCPKFNFDKNTIPKWN